MLFGFLFNLLLFCFINSVFADSNAIQASKETKDDINASLQRNVRYARPLDYSLEHQMAIGRSAYRFTASSVSTHFNWRELLSPHITAEIENMITEKLRNISEDRIHRLSPYSKYSKQGLFEILKEDFEKSYFVSGILTECMKRVIGASVELQAYLRNGANNSASCGTRDWAGFEFKPIQIVNSLTVGADQDGMLKADFGFNRGAWAYYFETTPLVQSAYQDYQRLSKIEECVEVSNQLRSLLKRLLYDGKESLEIVSQRLGIGLVHDRSKFAPSQYDNLIKATEEASKKSFRVFDSFQCKIDEVTKCAEHNAITQLRDHFPTLTTSTYVQPSRNGQSFQFVKAVRRCSKCQCFDMGICPSDLDSLKNKGVFDDNKLSLALAHGAINFPLPPPFHPFLNTILGILI